MKKKAFSILLSVILLFTILPVPALAGNLSNFRKVNTYSSGMFTDVSSTQWYADEVQLAFEYGLVNGKSTSTFEPDSNLKISEAVKIAACLHSIYNTGTTSFTNCSPWYRPYVDYALANGIISSEYVNYDACATRADFAVIFSKALPAEALTAINTINDDSIPDVKVNFTYGPAVYLLYKAGILTGSGITRAYNPNNNIKRSEVSAITARMANTTYRQTFTITAAELSSTEIAAKCSPAVFYIVLYDGHGQPLGSGSGFFISSSGLAVTNYHVIDGVSSAKIMTTDGKTYDVAGIYDTSKTNDLALIQINGSGFPYLEIGDSSTVLNGEKIYAIGSPRGMDNTITDGMVSNASRLIEGVNYIQISAAISPGSSGGALINSRGQVIGVTTMYMINSQNLNFAVPINLVQSLNKVYLKPMTSISYNVTASPSTFSITVGSTATVTITENPGGFDLYYEIADESVVACSWGDWTNNSCPIYIKGLSAGSTTVVIDMLDDYENLLASKTITITVTG